MKECFTIRGGRRLEGSLAAPGAKNAVLPLLAACLLADEEVTLTGCPRLTDVDGMLRILRYMGAEVRSEGDAVTVDPRTARDTDLPGEIMGELRSSVFLLGSLISRFGRAACAYPGGCNIGKRPIDLHLRGLAAMGVTVEEGEGSILCRCGGLRGAQIALAYPSVGATENLIMAAARADGTTVITGAAREPEIADLGALINAMGGRVRGAGGSTVTVEGVARLHGAEHRVIPDRIAAGTYLMAGAITGGDVEVTGVRPGHLAAVLDVLGTMGCTVDAGPDRIRLRRGGDLIAPGRVDTAPYPGFPTDLQAQLLALAAVARGDTWVGEHVFENRFGHVPELIRMGARADVAGRVAFVRGVPRLRGSHVSAPDLRAGAALVLAGLQAEGTTRVDNIVYIDRGYAALERNLTVLGADIRREV